jgi:hypothetical protein
MRDGKEIQAALEALREIEDERGLQATLILYTDGEGAMSLKDPHGTFSASVDFTDSANLAKIIDILSKRENMREE